MSEKKWTPGPWSVCNMTSWCCVDHAEWGTTVAEIGENDETGLANAHLIAAAPELYEALQAMIDLQENATPFGGEIYRDRVDRVFDQCRAALAKARGEK